MKFIIPFLFLPIVAQSKAIDFRSFKVDTSISNLRPVKVEYEAQKLPEKTAQSYAVPVTDSQFNRIQQDPRHQSIFPGSKRSYSR